MTRRAFRALLLVGFLDELAGVGFVAAADIEQELALSYAQVALALFTIPEVIALLVEPGLLLLADRLGTRTAMLVGLALMAAGLVGSAFVGTLTTLAAATTAIYVGSGVGTNLAKTALIDSHPERRGWIMARWTLFGAVGDIATPLFLGSLVAFGHGWRTGFAVVGTVVALHTLLLAFTPVLPRAAAHDETGAWTEVIRDLLGNRRLLAWLLASSTCGLLDEVFVAFSSLYLIHVLGADELARDGVLAMFMVGGVLGVLLLERVLAERVDPREVLPWSSLACALAVGAWSIVPGVWLSGVLIAVVGFFAAQLWPLTQAEAYRAHSGSATQVEVASGLFTPIALLLPLGMGLLADVAGLRVAMSLLLLQPLVVMGISFALRPQASTSG